jgi:hypothetical protein
VRATLLATLTPLVALVALSGCNTEEPENIQTRAENTSIKLEQRYKELEAEARNDAAGQIAPLDNEADALLNQMNAAGPAPVAGNAQ